jgi:alpha-aminoadipate carrier protein LysW
VEEVIDMAECPECGFVIELNAPDVGEIVECGGCGVDLEVVALEPVVFELAPEEREDWGE